MLTRSKKLKLEAEENAVKVPVYFNPQRIPIEAWNQIFLYNSTKDLLNLSLVCKTFYKTIGDLPAAMDKIKLKLSSYYVDNLKREESELPKEFIMKSTRNYSNLILRLLRLNPMNLFLKFIEKIGSNWKTSELSICCRISEKLFTDILELVHTNLRSLKVHEVHLKLNEAYTSKTFKFNQLQKFEISDCDSGVFEVLLDLLPNHLSEIVCENVENNFSIVELLEKQMNLKKLVINPEKNSYFLEIIGDADIKFELEELEIVLKESKGSNEKFDKFLKSQVKSLKSLILGNILVHQFNGAFKFMPKLEKLEMFCSKRERFGNESVSKFNCPSLRTLIIDFPDFNKTFGYSKFFERFDGDCVKEIIFQMAVTNSTMKKIAKSFPNLNKMMLVMGYDDAFNSVSFNNLEELHIIESMNTASRSNYKTLRKSVSTINNNLRVLKIGREVKVCIDFLRLVLKNFKNLKQLEIHDDSILDDTSLCETAQLFKNLKTFAVRAKVDRFEMFAGCMKEFPELICVFDENLEMGFFGLTFRYWNYCRGRFFEEDFSNDGDNNNHYGEEIDSDDSSSQHDD